MKHNFSGGPGALPEPVLQETARAIHDYEGTGISILGLSHRSPAFRAILDEAENNVRELLDLPAGFRVLFLQGGGTLQFAMVPMHLLRGRGRPAEYIVSGYWSARSVVEAQPYGDVRVIWNGEAHGYRRTPRADELTLSPDAAYLHYVSNETVEGVRMPGVLGLPGVPRVCDMSSDFLSGPQRIDPFDLVYAHAQKNLGPAGVTVVLVRDHVLEGGDGLPPILRYSAHAEHGSIYNTPPVFAIYVTMLVTRWLLREVGGLSEMRRINEEKAARLYALLDAYPDFFEPHAEHASRSLMNVTFRLRDRKLEQPLVAQAETQGFHGIGGHRSVGGLRVSLYNAVTRGAVDELVGFLDEFRASTRQLRAAAS